MNEPRNICGNRINPCRLPIEALINEHAEVTGNLFRGFMPTANGAGILSGNQINKSWTKPLRGRR